MSLFIAANSQEQFLTDSSYKVKQKQKAQIWNHTHVFQVFHTV